MKKAILFSIFAAFLLPSLAYSQRASDLLKKKKQRYENVYDREGFDNVDSNGDGYLSPDELRQHKDWTTANGLTDKKRVLHADTNNDGVVSLEEAKRQKRWEEKHWKGLAYKNRKELAKRAYKNSKYLQNHPKVAKGLRNNRGYLKKHPNVAREIYKDRKFLNNHPNFSKKAYEKRRFLANHPKATKKAHRFVENNPNKAKKYYNKAKNGKGRFSKKRGPGFAKKGKQAFGRINRGGRPKAAIRRPQGRKVVRRAPPARRARRR